MSRARLEEGSNDTVAIAFRIGLATQGHLDELREKLPSPFGKPSRAQLARSAMVIGLRVMAEQAGLAVPGLTQEMKPAGASKKSGGGQAARAAKRAAEREAAGCTCVGRHVGDCKLRKPATNSHLARPRLKDSDSEPTAEV